MLARTVPHARAWLSVAALAALLTACASTPEPDPMQVRLDDVDQRLGRVERVVNNQSLLDLSQRIDALETQLRTLRGQVEELQNGDQTLSKQQRDLYGDLNQRVAALESALKALGASGAPSLAAAGANVFIVGLGAADGKDVEAEAHRLGADAMFVFTIWATPSVITD